MNQRVLIFFISIQGAYSSGYGGYGAPMPMPGLSYGPAYNTAQRSPPQASFNYIPHDSGYLQ